VRIRGADTDGFYNAGHDSGKTAGIGEMLNNSFSAEAQQARVAKLSTINQAI
jgi:hypothetical protein